jgi:hypothetical protein
LERLLEMLAWKTLPLLASAGSLSAQVTFDRILNANQELSVNGRQYVAVSGGNTLHVFALKL